MAQDEQKSEETVESALKKLEVAQDERDQAKTALEAETADHNATKGNLANALSALSEQEETLTEASTVIAGQKETIAEQTAQIDTLQAKPSSVPVIVVAKKTYEVHAKTFQFEKVTYTVEQLLKDKPLQKKMVDKGVGFLIEQV